MSNQNQKSMNVNRAKKYLILLMAWWVFVQAQASVAQGADTVLTYFSVKKGMLSAALQRLQSEAHVNLLYDANDLKNKQVEAIEFRNVRVGSILRSLLKNTGLVAEEKQGIIILKAETIPSKATTKPVREIKGRITEEATKSPLPGVAVVVKGTLTGTTSDANGNYHLNVPEEATTLVFSFVGYQTREVAIGNQTTLDVALAQDVTNLQDIVVVGYGTQKKSEVTGAISSISPSDFNKGITSTPDQLLQGKVAGLTISRSGDPNGNPAIILRGASTLREGAAQEPFYVIDNIPGASINLIAPDDIVSIEVLKDASATAIYGSRAANGVILITTRKQKPSYGFSYNGYIGVENVSNKIDMLTGDELRELLKKNGKALSAQNEDGVNTDWQNEVMRTGISQNHSISYGGGTEKAVFNASVNYFKREGIMKNSANERLLGKISLEQKTLNDKLRLNFSLTNSLLKQNVIPQLAFKNMLRFLPTVNVYNPDGSFKEDLLRPQYYNPVALIETNNEDRQTNTLLASGRADLEITKKLSYSLSLSYQLESFKVNSYQSRNSALAQGQQGVAKRSVVENRKKILEQYLTYKPLNNDVHSLTILGGHSWQQDETGDGFQTSNSRFVSDALGYNNLATGNLPAGAVPDYGNFGVSPLRLISFFSRVNYSLKDRYFLQASLRADGSSAFGANNQWGMFPAVSIAWNLANESFMQNQSVVSDLKLRIGYGITGNSLGFDPLIARLRYDNGGFFLYNGSYIRAIGPKQNPNPDLKWEKTGMLNLGTDFGLFNGKIQGSVEVYSKKTSDLIWSYPVPATQYPVGKLVANVGEISNKGVEVTLSATPVQVGAFRWNVFATFSHNVNRVEKLADEMFKLEQVYTANPEGQGQSGVSTQIIQAGYPVGQFFTAEYLGRDEKGKSIFRKADGSVTSDPLRQDYQYAGNAQPKYLYGLNNTVTWKNWDLNVFFRGVYGNKIMNATLANLNLPNEAGNYNVSTFTRDEPLTDTRANWYSNRYIESGSYLRLDNLTLGYTLSLASKYLKKVRLYASSQNLFTVTNYRGIDPEINLGGLTPGLDNDNFYPKTRTFVGGVTLDF